MTSIGPDLICIKPIENTPIVVVISKNTARFKVIDLSLLSQTKIDSYAKAYRLAKVIQDGENARQVCISPQSPFVELLLAATESLVIDGVRVSQIKMMSDDEYQVFVAETVNAADPNVKKIDEENSESLAQKSGARVSVQANKSSTDSSKKSVSFLFSYLASKVNECFCNCSKKILEKFIEAERRIAELDKEAYEKKMSKRKEEKEELLKQDNLRADIKSVEIKKSLRAKA